MNTMSETATFTYFSANRPYKVKGGWDSYLEAAAKGGDTQHRELTIVDSSNNRQHPLSFIETDVTKTEKGSKEERVITGKYACAIKGCMRNVRISANSGSSSCILVILDD